MAKGNKTILALYGAANTGKTATLSKLIDLYKDLQKDMKEVRVEELPGFRWGDRGAVVHYKGKTIGIFTGGDSRDILEDAMNKLGENRDLYVCASHIKGQTADYLKKEKKVICWLRKADADSDPKQGDHEKTLHAFINNQQANNMLEMIEKILF